jgi:hypothetical protein
VLNLIGNRRGLIPLVAVPKPVSNAGWGGVNLPKMPDVFAAKAPGPAVGTGGGAGATPSTALSVDEANLQRKFLSDPKGAVDRIILASGDRAYFSRDKVWPPVKRDKIEAAYISKGRSGSAEVVIKDTCLRNEPLSGGLYQKLRMDDVLVLGTEISSAVFYQSEFDTVDLFRARWRMGDEIARNCRHFGKGSLKGFLGGVLRAMGGVAGEVTTRLAGVAAPLGYFFTHLLGKPLDAIGVYQPLKYALHRLNRLCEKYRVGDNVSLIECTLRNCNISGIASLKCAYGSAFDHKTRLVGVNADNADLRSIKIIMPGERTALTPSQYIACCSSGREELRRRAKMDKVVGKIFRDMKVSPATLFDDPELEDMLLNRRVQWEHTYLMDDSEYDFPFPEASLSFGVMEQRLLGAPIVDDEKCDHRLISNPNGQVREAFVIEISDMSILAVKQPHFLRGAMVEIGFKYKDDSIRNWDDLKYMFTGSEIEYGRRYVNGEDFIPAGYAKLSGDLEPRLAFNVILEIIQAAHRHQI